MVRSNHAIVGYNRRDNKQKSPAEWRGFRLRLNYLSSLLWNNVGRAGTLCTGFGIKSHLLAFCQCFESAALNGAMMDEYVFAAIRWGDKSKTFAVVKPLYCSCCHDSYLYL